MFDTLSPAAADPILSVVEAFRADARPHKLDLSVGVYRDAQGQTPVMAAVKAAERALCEAQASKSYLGLAGNTAFLDAVMQLCLPAEREAARWTAIQTPGASGALRLLADLLAATRPGLTVWISDPSYVNHAPILRAAGLQVTSYPYLDVASGSLRRDALFDTLAGLGPDDVLLLHGCCHNPSGVELSLADWQRIAGMASRQGFLPWVDLAYQGFGDGLEADAAGLQILARALPQLLVAYSCSKHFGLYRERTGAAMLLSRSAASAQRVQGKLFELARRSYSMAPDHGAEVVARILASPALTQQWHEELDGMRARIVRIRSRLADALAAQGLDGERLRRHKGMFSMLPLSPAQVDRLRVEHAIYLVGGGRLNLAGLDETRCDDLAVALAAVA